MCLNRNVNTHAVNKNILRQRLWLNSDTRYSGCEVCIRMCLERVDTLTPALI